jgi:hypothetical protein
MRGKTHGPDLVPGGALRIIGGDAEGQPARGKGGQDRGEPGHR